MIHLEEAFLREISSKLEQFKPKGNSVYQFRCPICGDSEKSSTKARGYVFPYKNHLVYKCHNCEASMSFVHFLKEYFFEEYKRYMMESLTTTKTWQGATETWQGNIESTRSETISRKFDKKGTWSKNVIPINDLTEGHPFRRYVEQRNIVDYVDLYYTQNFKNLVEEFDTEYAQRIPERERIVVPLLNRNNELKGIQGRSISINEQAKYLTIKFDNTFPKVWGLHRISRKPGTVYVFEGIFDACFFENSIAMLGSDIDHSTIKRYTNSQDIVYVLDNEPRSKETISKMKSLIQKGRQVVIWPRDIEVKDINDAVLKYGLEKTRNMIFENTFRNSLKAKVQFEQWRRYHA